VVPVKESPPHGLAVQTKRGDAERSEQKTRLTYPPRGTRMELGKFDIGLSMTATLGGEVRLLEH
jgi:hypothetical protein